MTNVDALADLVVSTIKGALAPMQADVRALQGQVAVWESRWNDLSSLRERVAVLDAKAAEPLPRVDVSPLEQRLGAAEALLTAKMGENAPLMASLADLSKEHAAMRERLTLVEVKAAQGGPQGPEGRPGRDGRDGLDFGDLVGEHDGERTFSLKAVNGDRVKSAGSFVLVYPIYRGVYVDGRTYEPADRVTWAGSEWHCNETTRSRPGDGSKAWTLCVKRGRDGKDGAVPPTTTVPVVKVGGR